MKLNRLIVTTPLATMLFLGAGWAQQNSDTPSLAETSAKSAKRTSKEKHWTGSLVDIACMAKTLGAEAKAAPRTDHAADIPHFTGAVQGAPQGGAGQIPSTGPGALPGREQPTPGTVSPDANQNPTGPDQEQAQMLQADRVDNAAKQCVASPLTQNLGLAMSGGQLVQFDQDGSAKAREALKNADLETGKKIKAKVTGTMEGKTTANVAAIEIKGKGKRGAANAGS